MDSNIEYKNLQFNINKRNEFLENQRIENFPQEENQFNRQYVTNNKPKIPMSYYFPESHDANFKINKKQFNEGYHMEDRYNNSLGMVNFIYKFRAI